MRAFLPFLAAASLLVLACDGGDGNGDGAGGGTTTQGTGGAGQGGASTGLPCDVDAILEQSCRMCHGSDPQFGAPMPLVTHADLHAPAPSDPSRMVYELVGARIHDDQDPMPPPPNARVGGADAAAIDAWVAAGAPSSAEACGGGSGGGGGGGGSPLGCTPDVLIKPSSPYQMPQQVEDAYICYGVDVQVDGKRHITALAPLLDNTTITHHMLLFAANSSYPSTPQPCVGASMGQLMAVWAPGGQALQLPPEAGFPIEGTAHFIVQMHYSNLMGLAGQEDSTGYQLCTTSELRPNDADILAFGTTQISIPANGSQDVTCDLTVPAIFPQITTIAGMPHMHKLGRLMSTTRLASGGNPEVDFGSADPWDFENQIWTLVESTISPGDVIRTRCAWDNPTPLNVGFGEGTDDEMCFGFVMYYPKIEVQNWNWMLPAFSASCSPTQ